MSDKTIRTASSGLIAAASSAACAGLYIVIRAVHDVSISTDNVDDWLGFAGALLAIPLSIGAAAWVAHRDTTAKDRKTVERVTDFVREMKSCLDNPYIFDDKDQCARHFIILAETIIRFGETATDLDSSLIYSFKAFKTNFERDNLELCDILINAPDDVAKQRFQTKSKLLRASTRSCAIRLEMLQSHL